MVIHNENSLYLCDGKCGKSFHKECISVEEDFDWDKDNFFCTNCLEEDEQYYESLRAKRREFRGDCLRPLSWL